MRTRSPCAEAPGPALAVAVLSDRIVRWVCDGDELRLDYLEIDRRTLNREIAELRESIASGELAESDSGPANRLFEWLLGPVAKALRTGKTVRVVLDGRLARLPLAALRDRATGHRLPEMATVVSLSSWPTRWFDPVRLDPSRSNGVFVGDPALPEDLVATYPSLTGALVETRALASRFAKSVVLTREQASKAKLLAALPTAAVLHLAAHGVARDLEPGRAAVLLAGSDASSELTAAEVSKLHLDHLQLVVLSACDSGAGFAAGSQGELSLAEGFLAAGAAVVVGARWPVDDSMSARFMEEFYSALTQGDEAPAALRRAQLRFSTSELESERRLSNWAGYFVVQRSDRLLEEEKR